MNAYQWGTPSQVHIVVAESMERAVETIKAKYLMEPDELTKISSYVLVSSTPAPQTSTRSTGAEEE